MAREVGGGTNHCFPSLPFDRYLSQHVFHHIDVDFPGVQLIHEDPFIFIINDFLSPEECDKLGNMLCSSSQLLRASATAPGQEARRTSTSMFPAPDDVQVNTHSFCTRVVPNADKGK